MQLLRLEPQPLRRHYQGLCKESAFWLVHQSLRFRTMEVSGRQILSGVLTRRVSEDKTLTLTPWRSCPLLAQQPVSLLL